MKFVEFNYKDSSGTDRELAIDIDSIISVQNAVSYANVCYKGGTLIDVRMWSDNKKVTYHVNLPYVNVMNKIKLAMMQKGL